MRIEDLNWMDVAAYLEKEDRLILVIGACEQHGYLSLLTDIKIPMAIADAASQASGVLVAPPVNFGCSPYFLDYAGSLSLRLETLCSVAEDLVRSAYRQGFRRLLFINGHGGNVGVKTRLEELCNELAGLRCTWYSWWLASSVEALAVKHQLKPRHANWLEAFSFTRVAEPPEGEKVPPFDPGIVGAFRSKQVYGDGSFGGPYQVAETIMDEMFAGCLKDVLQLIQFEG